MRLTATQLLLYSTIYSQSNLKLTEDLKNFIKIFAFHTIKVVQFKIKLSGILLIIIQ